MIQLLQQKAKRNDNDLKVQIPWSVARKVSSYCPRAVSAELTGFLIRISPVDELTVNTSLLNVFSDSIE